MKVTLSSSVTHSRWGWCQSHFVTGMTWCSPPFSLYSSSSRVFCNSCLRRVQSTASHQNSPSKHHTWRKKWASSTADTAQDGNIMRNKLKIWKPLLNSLSPPPKPHSPPSSSPVWTSHQGFAFEAGHLCHPCFQLAQRAPHSFYTCTHTHARAHTHTRMHTQRCRAGMLSSSLLTVQLANPWTQTCMKLVGWTTDSTIITE